MSEIVDRSNEIIQSEKSKELIKGILQGLKGYHQE